MELNDKQGSTENKAGAQKPADYKYYYATVNVPFVAREQVRVYVAKHGGKMHELLGKIIAEYFENHKDEES